MFLCGESCINKRHFISKPVTLSTDEFRRTVCTYVSSEGMLTKASANCEAYETYLLKVLVNRKHNYDFVSMKRSFRMVCCFANNGTEKKIDTAFR